MAYTSLRFKPGIVSDITSYSNEGGYVDGDKIRFRNGFPEKFGGWVKQNSNTYLGSARRLHNWVALDGSDFLGIGTHLKYYIEEGGTFNVDFDPNNPRIESYKKSFAGFKVKDGKRWNPKKKKWYDDSEAGLKEYEDDSEAWWEEQARLTENEKLKKQNYIF